jgi:hypothetical protein
MVEGVLVLAQMIDDRHVLIALKEQGKRERERERERESERKLKALP